MRIDTLGQQRQSLARVELRLDRSTPWVIAPL